LQAARRFRPMVTRPFGEWRKRSWRPPDPSHEAAEGSDRNPPRLWRGAGGEVRERVGVRERARRTAMIMVRGGTFGHARQTFACEGRRTLVKDSFATHRQPHNVSKGCAVNTRAITFATAVALQLRERISRIPGGCRVDTDARQRCRARYEDLFELPGNLAARKPGSGEQDSPRPVRP
jgi:hypothetical protein